MKIVIPELYCKESNTYESLKVRLGVNSSMTVKSVDNEVVLVSQNGVVRRYLIGSNSQSNKLASRSIVTSLYHNLMTLVDSEVSYSYVRSYIESAVELYISGGDSDVL